jgi:hypothetical protein
MFSLSGKKRAPYEFFQLIRIPQVVRRLKCPKRARPRPEHFEVRRLIREI